MFTNVYLRLTLIICICLSLNTFHHAYVPMFIHVSPCLTMFNTFYSCLPVYHCLNVLVYIYLRMFTHVNICLLLLTCLYTLFVLVYLCLPMLTRVYL